ncbi:anti-sigma-I factor RsgI family protein [Planococcus sp. YIM B11945]|uniref:anti-sigma-I factor RsgI family protein n=1 Tax=Planococcus sp. YIM B11945 TaxID=3435410 RepID=UPI003D7CE9F7
MHMQKGICIEVKGNRSIFLTADGEFIPGTAVNETAVGEEGYFRPLASEKTIFWKPIWVPLVAVLAVLAIVFSIVAPSGEAYAYVQLQINPGVEIGVNEKCQVISIRELNPDGHEVIGKLEGWKNQPLDTVLQRIIDLSLTGSTEEMTITTVAGENANSSLENMVMAISADALKNNVNVHLKKATKEQWRKSVKENVPVGQFIKEYESINQKNESHPEKLKEEPQEEKTLEPKETKKDLPASEPKVEDPPSEKPNEDKEPKKAMPDGADQIKSNPPVPKEKQVIPPRQNKKPQIVPNQNNKKATPPGHEKKKTEAPGKVKQKEKPQPPGKVSKPEKAQPPGKVNKPEKAKSPSKEEEPIKEKGPNKEKEPKKEKPNGPEKDKNHSDDEKGKSDKSNKE